MKYNREKHHRRSVRLLGHDYSDPGAYFVTICTWDRECIFSQIIDGKMVLNEYGRIAQREWLDTANKRPKVELDEYIVMPNHFHGILIINYRMNSSHCGMKRRGVLQYAPTDAGLRSPSQTIGAIIRGFKSAVTEAMGDPTDKFIERWANVRKFAHRSQLSAFHLSKQPFFQTTTVKDQ